MDDVEIIRVTQQALERVCLHTRRALEDLEEITGPYTDAPTEPIEASLLDALARVEAWLDELPVPEPEPKPEPRPRRRALKRHPPCPTCGAEKGDPCVEPLTKVPLSGGAHRARTAS